MRIPFTRFQVLFATTLVFDVVSALAARYAYNYGAYWAAFLAITSLVMAGYCFIKLLAERVTIVMNAMWIGLGSINVTLASYLVYGEVISYQQAWGMLIVVVGILLCEGYVSQVFSKYRLHD